MQPEREEPALATPAPLNIIDTASTKPNGTTPLRLPAGLEERLRVIESNVDALSLCVVACRGEACITRCVAVAR